MALNDYEDTIKSFIHDDDKLVTYKWISKELEIHVNVAKDILKEYWQKHKNDENIIATFLLVGQLKDGSIRVEVIRETNLDDAKKKFIKVDCEHLYSLQKNLQDIELLAYAGEGDLRYSAIKCNNEFMRDDNEIESLRYKNVERKEENKTNIISENNEIKKKIIEKQPNKKSDVTTNKKSISKNKADHDKCSKVEVGKKNDNNIKSDTNLVQDEKESPPNKTNLKSNKVSKKPIQSKQSGFNNLFGKTPQVFPNTKEDISKDMQKPTDTNEKKVESIAKKKNTKLIEEKKDIKSSEEKEDWPKKRDDNINKSNQEKENQEKYLEEKSKDTAKNNRKKNEKLKPKNEKTIRGRKRNRSQEDNASSKRKRIVVIDSSEDESNKSCDEEEEIMEVEEEQPQIIRKRSPSPPKEKRENGKRMVRKTINKTFKDEEGYLVTKKVHVYEEASDSEEPIKIKPEEETKKTKPVENKSKKQTTLMNFFKKP